MIATKYTNTKVCVQTMQYLCYGDSGFFPIVHSRFEYNASASLVKEVSFEETEGLNEHTHFESI